MKKLVLVAVFLLGFSVMTMAQETPAIEVFGGYSFVMVDTVTAFPEGASEDMDLSLNGWNVSAAFNGNKWAGFVADVGGLYGSLDVLANNEDSASVDVRIHSVMFGPRFSLHRGAVTPFIQMLFGYARITADMDGDNILKENDFAMAFGGGVDVKLNKRIAFRPVQLEYFTTKAGLTGDFADHLRYSTGIVIKLGSR